ncbi:MAG: hypothetical protein EOP88_19540 [Verrucomicrobiaceae bacterium]|nr:MAG: hypothetical protein EOP88_19540 [Verrucomicrobiaceae bacterium]
MILTTNGNHEITLIPGRDYAIFVTGNSGGGTLALSIANHDLSGILPLPGYESILSTASFVLTAPSHRLLVSFTGATNPEIALHCVLCP